jgi:hypothetical protein
MVRTQYFGELIDEQAGMFPPERLALMVGTHPRQPNPPAGLPRGRNIAFLLDVGGEASLRAGGEANGRRDATALTIVEVDASRASDPAVGGPVYRVLDRRRWTGENHNRLLAGIRALAENWRARALVVDATGVGAGLASFLEKALPGRVTPFVFSAASKSRLGWGFLAVVETGRYREYAPQDDLQALFWREARLCRASVFPGPEKRMAWGVPDGTRDPADGTPVHDDLLLSAALVAELERMEWGGASTRALVVPGRDPLAEIEGF